MVDNMITPEAEIIINNKCKKHSWCADILRQSNDFTIWTVNTENYNTQHYTQDAS